MAKVIKLKGDATDVQTDFNHAPTGLYRAKVASIEETTGNESGKPQVALRWELTKTSDGKKLMDAKGKPASYASVFYYAPLDLNDEDMSPGWARRMKELLVAFGLKMKGADLGKIEGKEALIRLREGTDDGGDYRPNISKILPLKAAEDEGEEDEEEDEGEEEEAEEYTKAELKALDNDDLKGVAEEYELEVPKRLTAKGKTTLIAAILEAQEAAGEEEEEDEEEEDEDEVDLEELSRKELKAYIKENELEVKVTTKMDDDAVRAAIQEALGGVEEEEEEDEEEEDEPDDNYDELSPADLKQECNDRELSDKGKKSVLIARLRKDDLENPV